MNLNEQNVSLLNQAISVCKILGIESIILHEDRIRGMNTSMDAVILSDLSLGLPNVSIGIGRVAELSKRLSAMDKASIDITTRDDTVASVLTIKSGRSRMQFRCTAASQITAPKANDDEPIAEITLTADEVKHVVKVVNTMGAEHIVLQLTRQGDVRIEAIDPSTNDALTIELTEPGVLLGDERSFVFNYLSAQAIKVLNAAQIGESPVTLTIGQIGSMTFNILDHQVIIMAQLTDADLGYED